MGYERGEEVLRDEPFSYIVKVECRSTVCDFCLKQCKTSQKAFKNCSACKLVYYCNSTCQRNAWDSHHRAECVYLKKGLPPIVLKSEAILLTIRIILRLQKEGDKEFVVQLPNGQKRCFSDLMSHKKDIENDPDHMETFRNLYVLLKASLMGNLPSESNVLEIYGKMMVNAFNIQNDIVEPIGFGLYLGASILDHSCAPNAHWHHNGKHMIIKTIENVESFDDLRQSYLTIFHLTASTKKRREKLMKDHYFFCECSKCKDVPADQMKSSLICIKCKGCIPVKIGACTTCNYEIDKALFEKQKSIRKQILNVSEKQFFKNLYEQAIEIFHPFDTNFTSFLTLYSSQQYEEKNYSFCLDVSRLKLIHLRQHVPPYQMNIGSEEIMFSKLCTWLGLFEEAEEHINIAKDILQVNFGMDHPLLDKEWKPIRQQIDKSKQSQKYLSN